MKIEGKEYRTIWFEENLVKIISCTKQQNIFVVRLSKKRCFINRLRHDSHE